MSASDRILVAGIGNIFLGDDAFGVEVVKELTKSEFPEGVNVVDFGFVAMTSPMRSWMDMRQLC